MATFEHYAEHYARMSAWLRFYEGFYASLVMRHGPISRWPRLAIHQHDRIVRIVNRLALEIP